jgi:hypothetical protein
MIGAGVPGSAAEWPDGILAALRTFRQGDLVAVPPMAYLADPQAPVWAESSRFAEEVAASGEQFEPEIIRFPESLTPPYGMITTQMCDLVEEDADPPGWPWAQLVPVYDMDQVFNSGQKKLLRQARFRRSLLHVPAVTPGFYVADFRISFPVEKGWLARQPRIDGFGTEELRQRVGDRLALLSGRPAFAGSFVATIQNPLTAALRDLKRTDREAFERMDELVPEVGVQMDSRLNPSNVQVVVVSTAPLDSTQSEWWNRWWDGCRQSAAAVGITLQALDFKVLDENYSAAEYRRLTHLPLANVSPD